MNEGEMKMKMENEKVVHFPKVMWGISEMVVGASQVNPVLWALGPNAENAVMTSPVIKYSILREHTPDMLERNTIATEFEVLSFSTESGKVESLFEVPRERGPITEIGADEENIFVIADGQKFSLYSLPDCVAMILGSTPEPVLHGDSFHKDGIFIYVDGQEDALWLVAPEGSGEIEIPDELCTFPNNVARWGSTVMLSCKRTFVAVWYNHQGHVV